MRAGASLAHPEAFGDWRVPDQHALDSLEQTASNAADEPRRCSLKGFRPLDLSQEVRRTLYTACTHAN